MSLPPWQCGKLRQAVDRGTMSIQFKRCPLSSTDCETKKSFLLQVIACFVRPRQAPLKTCEPSSVVHHSSCTSHFSSRQRATGKLPFKVMLSSRVSVPLPSDPTQEDFFSSSISSLFTDDTQNSHGTPGQAVIYHSPRYGEIKLGIPQHPDVDERRKLFAHYLWNSGVVAADAIECASHDQTGESNAHSGQEGGYTVWDQRYWNVRDKDVLELGAGT